MSFSFKLNSFEEEILTLFSSVFIEISFSKTSMLRILSDSVSVPPKESIKSFRHKKYLFLDK